MSQVSVANYGSSNYILHPLNLKRKKSQLPVAVKNIFDENKNIFDESAKNINFIELQFLNTHLFNILCDEKETTHKALKGHSEVHLEEKCTVI